MRIKTAAAGQLGFDMLLEDTDALNERRVFEKRYGHLPATLEAAVPFYRDLLVRHHAAMLAANSAEVTQLRNEAHDLALRLNNGEPGIIAGPETPGSKLAGLTVAPDGEIPLWGQQGSFVLELPKVRVRIELDGLFGIGASHMPWMNMAAHAVDWAKPFISETGFRSFMGIRAQLVPDMTPDAFARLIIETHIERDMKGRLVRVAKQYRPKA